MEGQEEEVVDPLHGRPHAQVAQHRGEDWPPGAGPEQESDK